MTKTTKVLCWFTTGVKRREDTIMIEVEHSHGGTISYSRGGGLTYFTSSFQAV